MPQIDALARSNRSRPLHVLKFGGTSVGSPQGIRRVVDLVTEARTRAEPIVVVSAAAGVTDVLVEAADEATRTPDRVALWTERVGRRYWTLARETLPHCSRQAQYERLLQVYLAELNRGLRRWARTGADRARDEVLATGERLMAPLLVAALQAGNCDAEVVDAVSLIRTTTSGTETSVDHASTEQHVKRWHRNRDADRIPVIPGFLASTPDGNTTTLGRGGSDYSASLLAAALNASLLVRWTDVDGLYTKDPEIHDDARPLDRLSFDQARSWAKTGRLGVHPRMLDPLSNAQTTVQVRCTNAPEKPGTCIVPSRTSAQMER